MFERRQARFCENINPLLSDDRPCEALQVSRNLVSTDENDRKSFNTINLRIAVYFCNVARAYGNAQIKVRGI